MTTHAVTVRHNFETAHRLPHLVGKCQSLHGHSWVAEVTVTGPELAAGVLVEFGRWKAALRKWIDTHLDHGTMLSPTDPLVPVLVAHGCKVYTVEGYPTVENVAALIAHQASNMLLIDVPVAAPHVEVTTVRIQETAVNEAAWHAA